MRILLLNWAGGENDPFTYFNRNFQRQLSALGHTVQVVSFDERLATTLFATRTSAPIDMVFTWQGIGSGITESTTGKTIWELLDVPLICLHGDHPCYNPANHQQKSRHVVHVYLCQSFFDAANRLVSRQYPALFEALPNFFSPPDIAPVFDGEYFVMPKNLTDPDLIRQSWRQRHSDAVCNLLFAAAEAIEHEFRNGNTRNHHEVLLDVLPAPIPDMVRSAKPTPAAASLVLDLARELDPFYRNLASVFVLDALADVPVRVNGRGWERFAARNNPMHHFHPFDRTEDGDAQFHSAHGIIDIAPANDALHDRTMRAMRMGSGFLVSSAWRRGQPIHDDFADLFIGGDPRELATRLQNVRANPEAHRARARAFSQAFDEAFPFTTFMDRMRGHVDTRGFALSD